MRFAMFTIRAAKAALVAAVALHASLVAFGNMTDYGTNFAFVQHVLLMDTIFPGSKITWRAIAIPALHHVAYGLIIAVEVATALLCWVGTFQLFGRLSSDARTFNQAKAIAVAGLLLGIVLWLVGFVTVGGEWFGMWQSQQWNGVPTAFRLVVIILGVLIFVAMPDDELGFRRPARSRRIARRRGIDAR